MLTLVSQRHWRVSKEYKQSWLQQSLLATGIQQQLAKPSMR